MKREHDLREELQNEKDRNARLKQRLADAVVQLRVSESVRRYLVGLECECMVCHLRRSGEPK